MAIQAKNLILYIDEVNMLCTPNGLIPLRSAYWSQPDHKHKEPVISKLLNYGRHQGIAMVMTSRMPAQVNRLLTDGCSEMRLFRSTEGLVLAYFRQKSEAASNMLPGLRDYEFVLWQDGKEPIKQGGRR